MFLNEKDNASIWNESDSGHYEVWYITLNHQALNTGYWIRYTIHHPTNQEAYAQLWFAAFNTKNPSKNIAINQKFPIASLKTNNSPFNVSIGNSQIKHDSAHGEISGAGHHIKWDLGWKPNSTTHRHLPDFMYANRGLGQTTALSPNIDISIHGTITINGESIVLEGDRGGQSHVWGKKHAHTWAWGHCNDFDGGGAVLETVTARIKHKRLLLPPVTMLSLSLGGQLYQWNQLQHLPRNFGRYKTGHYTFRGNGALARISGTYICRAQDMVVATYTDPDGDKIWCSHTDVANLEVTLWTRVNRLAPWNKITTLSAPHRGHFEIAHRTDNLEVTKHHTEILSANSMT